MPKSQYWFKSHSNPPISSEIHRNEPAVLFPALRISAEELRVVPPRQDESCRRARKTRWTASFLAAHGVDLTPQNSKPWRIIFYRHIAHVTQKVEKLCFLRGKGWTEPLSQQLGGYPSVSSRSAGFRPTVSARRRAKIFAVTKN